MNVYDIAAIWVAMALVAAAVGIRFGVSAALVEMLVGAVCGNVPGLREHLVTTSTTTFLAGVGSILLTFLAGAEVDPVSFRRHWRASVAIGLAAFAVPFGLLFAYCRLVLNWPLHASEIGGISLSTTSVAVIYAVLVETGLNRLDVGKLILAACFVCNLGTVLVLGGLFADYGRNLVIFLGVSAGGLALLPAGLRFALARFGHRVSEPEIKFLLAFLLVVGGLSTAAGSVAVFPAYLAGLVCAGVFLHDRKVMDRMRSVAFAFFTPFFFLDAGLRIKAGALVPGAAVIGALFVVKMATKFASVWPTAALHAVPTRERMYTTLLMATGLTFGSISALFGLQHGLIDQDQYTELVAVVLLSAFVPTIIAQRLFQPAIPIDTEEEEALAEEDLSIVHRKGRARPPRSEREPGGMQWSPPP